MQYSTVPIREGETTPNVTNTAKLLIIVAATVDAGKRFTLRGHIIDGTNFRNNHGTLLYGTLQAHRMTKTTETMIVKEELMMIGGVVNKIAEE
jgi:hypothetical protein